MNQQINLDNFQVQTVLTLAQVNVMLEVLDKNVPHGVARPIVDALRESAITQLKAAEEEAMKQQAQQQQKGKKSASPTPPVPPAPPAEAANAPVKQAAAVGRIPRKKAK